MSDHIQLQQIKEDKSKNFSMLLYKKSKYVMQVS